MARKQFTVHLRDEVSEGITALALREERTFSQMADRLLASALSERDNGGATAHASEKAQGVRASTPGDPDAPVTGTTARSASAELSAGANGKSTKRKAPEAAPARTRLLVTGEPRGKTRCKDPLHGRTGWRCRGCGEMF